MVAPLPTASHNQPIVGLPRTGVMPSASANEPIVVEDDDNDEPSRPVLGNGVARLWHSVFIGSASKSVEIGQDIRLIHEDRRAGLGATDDDPHPMTAIRYLWVGTRSQRHPRVLKTDHVTKDCELVAKTLISNGDIQGLAVDVTLLADGWFGGKARIPRPTKMILLAFAQAPRIPDDLSVYKEVTHLIIEPFWDSYSKHYRGHSPFKYWPALTHLCLRFRETADPRAAISAVMKIANTTGLEQFIICVDSFCGSRSKLWHALRALRSQYPDIRVLRVWSSVLQEWDVMCNGGRSIWARAEEEANKDTAADGKPDKHLLPDFNEWVYGRSIRGAPEDVSTVDSDSRHVHASTSRALDRIEFETPPPEPRDVVDGEPDDVDEELQDVVFEEPQNVVVEEFDWERYINDDAFLKDEEDEAMVVDGN